MELRACNADSILLEPSFQSILLWLLQTWGLELFARVSQIAGITDVSHWCHKLFFFLPHTGSLHVVHAGLEVMILLPQPPECWD
jgi:hypothetical protein